MPLYLDGEWDLEKLEKRVNRDSPDGLSAGWDSIWSWGQHHDILYRMTYMFRSTFAEKVFRRWLGYELVQGFWGPKWEKKKGRLCLPAMLLHPIDDSTKK